MQNEQPVDLTHTVCQSSLQERVPEIEQSVPQASPLSKLGLQFMSHTLISHLQPSLYQVTSGSSMHQQPRWPSHPNANDKTFPYACQQHFCTHQQRLLHAPIPSPSSMINHQYNKFGTYSIVINHHKQNGYQSSCIHMLCP